MTEKINKFSFDKKIKKTPLAVAVLIIVSTVVFSVVFGDWQAKRNITNEVKPPAVSLNAGKATGRFIWTNYGAIDQNIDPAIIPGVIPTETVRFVSADLNSQVTAEENLIDIITIANSKPDFVTLLNRSGKDSSGLTSQGYVSDSNAAGNLSVFWKDSRWNKLAGGSENFLDSSSNGATHWVTLQSRTTDRKVSIIATSLPQVSEKDFAPVQKYVKALEKLTSKLEGQVIIGANININYKSAVWSAAGLNDTNLLSTYDIFGDFDGGTTDTTTYTLDYMMFYRDEAIIPSKQGKWNQSGEYDALWSEWNLSSDAGEASKKEISKMVLAPEKGVFAY